MNVIASIASSTSTLTSSSCLDLAVGLAWKSTVWLIAVLLLVRAAMGRRASVASAIANAGLAGLLLLPASPLVLPRLAVSCLPAADEAPAGPAPTAFARPSAGALPVVEPGQAPDPAVTPQEERIATDAPRPAVEDASLPTRPSDLPPAPSSRGLSMAIAAFLAYALVTGLFLLRLVGGLAAVATLRRGALAVDDPTWCAALRHWWQRLALGREVGLAWSAGVSVPVVVGWRRPLILLPATAAALDPRGHADAVLLHELAHVRRGDYAWNLVQRLAVALFWIHPLAWMLARWASEARERACDDLCVHEVGGPAAYRSTLLAVASGLVRRPGPSLGLAMARTSRLERRLTGIDRSRGSAFCLPRRPARWAIAGVGLVAAATVGASQLTRAQAARAADEPKAAAATPGKDLHLRIVAAATGEPAAKANVRVWMAISDERRTADDEGRLTIRHSTGPADTNVSVDVWGDGLAMQRHSWGGKPGEPIPDEVTIRLQPGETLGGIVQDEQGRPIAGAEVFLWSHNYKKADPHAILFDLRAVTRIDGRWSTSGAPETTGELLGFHIDHPDYLSDRDYGVRKEKPTIAELRARTALSVMTKGVPIEGRVLDAEGRPVAGATVFSSNRQDALHGDVRDFAVTTDEAGHFRTGQVRSEEVYLLARAAGHAPAEQRIKVGRAVPQVELRLGRARTLSGRVVDPAGKPISGAFVNVDTWRRYRFLGVFLYTDADGRFRWDDAPEGAVLLNVMARGYTDVFRREVDSSINDLVVRLDPALMISGRVADAGSGKRIERAEVEYAAVDPKSGDVVAWITAPPTGSRVFVHDGYLTAMIPVAADAYKLRIVADGYEPFVSRAFRRDEIAVHDYDVKLVPGRAPGGPVARVVKADGQPLAGARVYVGVINQGSISLKDGKYAREGEPDIRTAADGSFPIPTRASPWVVLIVGEDGWVYANKDALAASPNLEARPYTRVEGRYQVGRRPGARVPVELQGLVQNRSTARCVILVTYNATTDDDGRFVFDRVIPTPGLRVARKRDGRPPGESWSNGAAVDVEPGATATVTVGGAGRPVVGRVEAPDGWAQPIDFTEHSSAGIRSNTPTFPYPPSLFRDKATLQGGEWSQWSERFLASPEGREHRKRQFSGGVALALDGSFRIDDVPPGDHVLSIWVNEERPLNPAGPFAPLVLMFSVPPIPGGRTERPLDLGVLRLRPRAVLKAGDPAPPFEVVTVDGRRLAVPGDFRGKVLLLDFSEMWTDQSRFQIARLNDVHQRFGDDPRFATLSLTLAEDNATTRAFIAEKGQPWPQAIVGPLSAPIYAAYGLPGEFIQGAVLIGPDGRLLGTQLFTTKIGEAIGEALRPE